MREELMQQERQQTKKPWRLRFGKKGKKVAALAVVLAAVILLAAVVLPRLGQGGAAAGAVYRTDRVCREDLAVTVSGSATLQPADAYQVTTLVSGEVLEAPFEEGDLISQGALLYAIDSGDAQNSVERAGLSVQQAVLNWQQAQEALCPTAPISGTLREVYVHNGDNVTAGTALAKIVADTDLTIDFLFAYADPSDFYVGQSAKVYVGSFEEAVQGTVVSVSNDKTLTAAGQESIGVRVRVENPGVLTDAYTASAVIGTYNSCGKATITMPGAATVYASGSGMVSGFEKLAGSTVKKGEILCTVDSENSRNQLETARLSLESAKLSAQSAQGTLEDYNITSPISGTVIEKQAKAGDKVDGAGSGTLAVIYDLSCLKMEMNVNELDIGKVRTGQTVEVTAGALPDQRFTGVVEKVSINGTTKDGFTTYPVTIAIWDYGELKPGMNVTAVIQAETLENALCVPVAAVERGGTVLVAPAETVGADGTVADISRLEERAVTLGVNDAQYIQITSGLAEGEFVAYPEQAADIAAGG